MDRRLACDGKIPVNVIHDRLFILENSARENVGVMG